MQSLVGGAQRLGAFRGLAAILAVGIFVSNVDAQQARECAWPAAAVLVLYDAESLTPDPSLVAPIQADLDLIYDRWPILAAACANVTPIPSAVGVETTPEIAREFFEGTYSGFDDLLNELGSHEARGPNEGRLSFWFEDLYNSEILASLFQSLPDVLLAYPFRPRELKLPSDELFVRFIYPYIPHEYLFTDGRYLDVHGTWIINTSSGVPVLLSGDLNELPISIDSWGSIKGNWE